MKRVEVGQNGRHDKKKRANIACGVLLNRIGVLFLDIHICEAFSSILQNLSDALFVCTATALHASSLLTCNAVARERMAKIRFCLGQILSNEFCTLEKFCTTDE